MKVFLFIISLIAALTVILFISMCAVAVKCFGRTKNPYNSKLALKNRPELLKVIEDGEKELRKYTPETVSIESRDGLKLKGFYYSCGHSSDRFLLCFHGYHSDANNDFAPSMGFLLNEGYNMLTVCQRAHSLSEGKYLTFGVKERFDCADWCNYIVKRFGNNVRIVLNGVSMGSATVTLAGNKSVGLPENVKAILADCGYSSPWEEICHVAKTDYHLPVFPFVHMLRLTTKIICGFDIREGSSVDAVRNTEIPFFFAHGKSDNFVPYDMGAAISEACASPHELFSAENAGHGLSFLVETEKYKEEVKKFLEKYVN